MEKNYSQQYEQPYIVKKSDECLTDFGKGISFKSLDGREWATFEQAEAANNELIEYLIRMEENELEKDVPRPRHLK